jgi:hypothetical protein
MDVILVALQLAVEVSRRSRQIEDSTKSWAIVVKDIHANDLQGMIDSFNENQVCPQPRMRQKDAFLTQPRGFLYTNRHISALNSKRP